MKRGLALLCGALTLCACQALTGLEKLRVGPTAGASGDDGQLGAPMFAADGGGGTGAGEASGGAGTPSGGMRAAHADAGASDDGNSAGSGGMGLHNHTSVKPPEQGGQSAPPAADGGGSGSPPQGVPSSGPPREDNMDSGGAQAPGQGGSDAPRAGASAADGGGGGDTGGASAAAPAACVPPASGGARCDTAPQCGCSSDQQCAFVSDRLACVRSGNGALNQACTRAADCQPGLQCLGGACLQLCDPGASDCMSGSACEQFYGDLNRPVPGGYICLSECDLADPQRASNTLSACGAGLQCIWTGTGSYCVRSEQGTRGHGEVCNDSFDCMPGFACLQQHTCGKWCASSSDCPSNFYCESSQDVRVNGTDFGVCKPSCAEPELDSCSVRPQCGCASGQACDFLNDPSGNNVRACRADGRKTAFSLCTVQTECATGTSCIDGTCQPFCNNDLECGGGYAQCVQIHATNLPSLPPISGFYACERPCDPADVNLGHGPYGPCSAGRNCIPKEDGRSYCLDASQQIPVGSSCKSDSQCAVGQVCGTTVGCVTLCRNAADCANGVACNSFEPRLYATDVEWGFCSVSP